FVACRDEGVVAFDHARVKLRPLLDVRLDEELSTSFEQSRHLPEEKFAHDEALVMTLLPPRVREVEEHALHARVGSEPWECEPRVLAEHAGAGAEAVL